MEEARAGRLTVGLRTPRDTVQKLRKSLHEKAKAEPGCRFYSLWDKVCRDDVIEHLSGPRLSLIRPPVVKRHTSFVRPV